MPELVTRIGALSMRNPIMLASGTVGYGPEHGGIIDFSSVGAFVTKTVTLEPKAGNRPPRLCETAAGLLNAIGLENVGLTRFLQEKLPEAAKLPAPLVASIAGKSTAEVARLAGEIGACEEVTAIELNISCPNIERPRAPLWADPDGVAEMVSAARSATDRTLLVKLSPAAADVVSVAEAAERAGADALVVANTLTGMRIDIDTGTPALGNATGGLSGKALLPVNLALVWTVAPAVSIPVVGCGGIETAEDALEYLMAGANAVQVGTALFKNPSCPGEIAEGLLARMRKDGIETPAGYVGLARTEAERWREILAAD